MYSRVGIVLFLCELVNLNQVVRSCEEFPSSSEVPKIVNASINSVVMKANNSLGASYSVKLVIRWNVNRDILYDGFLYKVVERKKDDGMDFLIYPEFLEYEYDVVEECNTTSGKWLWATSQNGTSVKCIMPCAEYFPQDCLSMEVCKRRNEEAFLPLSKDTRSVVIDAKFGTEYDVTILIYRKWKVLSEFHLDSPVTFCNDELITRYGVDESNAKSYCDKMQNITAFFPTGPPSNFQLFKVSHDLISNRANVTFRWQKPHDISTHVLATERYLIHTSGGRAENHHITSRCYGSYYCAEVKGIKYEATNTIRVTPFPLLDKDNCMDSCHGYAFAMNYTIPDIDACNDTSFCDARASCVDLPSTNRSSAICECPPGYVGNGVNESLPNGSGCKDFDACASLGETTCATQAECIDLPPPSMKVNCSCREDYVGDGYSMGSGCTKLSVIISAAMVVPVVAVFAIVVFLFLRKVKMARVGREKFSRFFVSDEIKYESPISVFGTTQIDEKSSGIFGSKYEIERERIQLTGILGRGNFGVVHKATMKVDDGYQVVAVKTTAEPHSKDMERDFLAEIALIKTIGEHDSVMGMLGCCTGGNSIIYLVTKYMKYGDLQHFLWDAREESKRAEDPIYNLTEMTIYKIGEQVASGLEHLTGLRIIHGDIAARNILIDEGLVCKLSDFGLANDVYRYGAIRGAREKHVPIKWISPERMQAGKVPITWRSDVWSYGILLYECITLGSTPFSEVSPAELLSTLRLGYRMSKPVHCSNFLYNMMIRCWEWTPSKRPSFKEISKILRKMQETPIQPFYINLSENVE